MNIKRLDKISSYVTLVTDKLQGECYEIQYFIFRYNKLED